MGIRHTWAAWALAAGYASGAGAAGWDASTEKMVGFAATMTAMAQACQHMSGSEITEAKAKQRQAMVGQGADGKVYDAAYAAAEADFAKRWTAMPAAKQKSTCDEVKKHSDMAAAQAQKMAK